MKERGILFQEESIRAILAGRKTQTRRVINVPTPFHPTDDGIGVLCATGHLRCPYGEPGDHLWAKETYALRRLQAGIWIEYRADGRNARLPSHVPIETALRYVRDGDTWCNPMFMPRAFSRITSELVRVHPERLHDISEGDAYAEGIDQVYPEHAVGAYRMEWDRINAKRGHSWPSNPWVWALTFRRVV